MPPPAAPVIRRADLLGTDAAGVGRLVRDYLGQTEREKAEHQALAPGTFRAGGDTSPLPERYRPEVEHPRRAYRNAVVHVAELAGRLVGVVVGQRAGDAWEIKRLWVDPEARGLGAGVALLDAAVRGQDRPVRLTVWEWRTGALALYRSRGFSVIPSWDGRTGLVCLERPPATSSASAASPRSPRPRP
ncbi:hypothetical protein GCM10011331_08600 [Flavimobilis marinus]|uniref:Acetyltransferase (GNAT) family protein n=1 Tax=Flavimobilis marinus TaxID=285351 RepID=A0A1I2CHJ2_9MICO|nr:GNAT family N-acetyltransferase [Flavimobilis marinus]GHG47622.1 hypothetical protein GCM10011331_08600 [Flavimobilis marinus]SFE67708.1 Acetyltransferase (GNAT) family protein [Flavimobilis marinus]